MTLQQIQINHAEFNQIQLKKHQYKLKYIFLKKILKSKLPPFLIIQQNEKQINRSIPKWGFFSKLYKVKKVSNTSTAIKYDSQAYTILLEGDQNDKILERSQDSEFLYISQGESAPFSLGSSINTFIGQCQRKELRDDHQQTKFDNCLLCLKKNDAKPIELVSNNDHMLNSIQLPQVQRKVHFSTAKKVTINLSPKILGMDGMIKRRNNKNSIILNANQIQGSVLLALTQKQNYNNKSQHEKKDLITQSQFYNIELFYFELDKRPAVIVTFKENMTEVYGQRIAELEKLNKYKDYILASVSHDFKTPINGINAHVDALMRTQQNAQDKLYLEIIKKNISLLLFMIADIQDNSKIERNELTMRRSRCNIQHIVDDVIDLMKIQAQQKKIELKNQILIKNQNLLSDPDRIKQILHNLVSNALKFTLVLFHVYFKRGSIMIKVVQVESSRNLLRVSVSDTGVGIPEDVISKLFKPYQTFDQKGLNKNGVGLGLVSCNNIIQKLGPEQQIQVESIQNIGTTFTFLLFKNLPELESNSSGLINSFVSFNKSEDVNFHSSMFLFSKRKIQTTIKIQDSELISSNLNVFEIKQDNMIAKSTDDCLDIYLDDACLDQTDVINNITEHQKDKTNYRHKSHQMEDLQLSSQIIKINILVVDDEPFNVLAFKAICNQPDLHVDEAYSGQEAVLKVKNLQYRKLREQADRDFYYDFVFLDLNMPLMNGYDTAKAILKMIQHQQIRPLHLIALSGYDDIRDQEASLNLGFDAFIPKPAQFEYLRQILREISPRTKYQ